MPRLAGIFHTTKSNCCISFETFRYPDQVLPIGQWTRAALDIPPAGRRVKEAASFQYNITVTATLVNVIGQLPYTAHQVLKSIRIGTLPVFSDRIRFTISEVTVG